MYYIPAENLYTCAGTKVRDRVGQQHPEDQDASWLKLVYVGVW